MYCPSPIGRDPKLYDKNKGETFILYYEDMFLGWDSMGLGSRKFSEGSRSLFGSISIPNLKKSEFADAFRSGVGQISALAKKNERTYESPMSRRSSSGTRDLSAYGFENFQVSDDIEVFVHGTTAEEAFKNSEMVLKPATVETKVTRVQIPVPKAAKIEDYSAQSSKAPVAKPAAAVKKQPVVKAPVVEVPVVETPVVEAPVEEAPVVEAPVEQIVPEAPAEPVAEVPVVEQPKLEEFEDQPLIIRPEIIDEVDVPAKDEEVAIMVGKIPVTEENFNPQSLFGNIKRGKDEKVDAHVGELHDGFIKESASNIAIEDYEFIQSAEDIRAETAAIDEMEIMESKIDEALIAASAEMMAEAPAEEQTEAQIPEEERVMLMPYVQQSTQLRDVEDEVPYVERAVPKLEDFIRDEPEVDVEESVAGFMCMMPAEQLIAVKAPVVIPEWDVTEASAEVYADYLAAIPEETTWAKAVIIPEWDTAAENYAEYLGFIPEESTWTRAAVIPEWDVTEASAETFTDYISLIPEETTWARAVVVPEWDVTEASAEVYADYLASIPEETTWAVEPVWEIADETAETYVAYLNIWPQYPKAAVIIPEWDTAAESYAEYLSFIPEETTWAVAPVWDVTEEAVDAFAAYMTIWPQYPKAAVVIPEWDVTEACAETYTDYLAAIPEESTWAVEPVWEIADETAESYVAFQTIRPEYPKAVAVIPEWDTAAENYSEYLGFIPEESTWAVAPVWDVTEEASAAFIDFGTIRPEYPKAVAVIPEWDVTEAAVAGFEGYRTAEEDYFNKSMMVVATTVSVNRIELDAIERHVSNAVAAVSGVTGTYAETASQDDLQITIKDNTDFNQENLQVVPELDPEKKVRTSRFVFKDGRLQKITEEVVLDEVDTTIAETSATVSEDVAVEEMPVVEEKAEIIALPAAQAIAALPAPVAKSEGGVNFSFGQSKNSYGSVRFFF